MENIISIQPLSGLNGKRYNNSRYRACSSGWIECNPPKVEVVRSNRTKHANKKLSISSGAFLFIRVLRYMLNYFAILVKLRLTNGFEYRFLKVRLIRETLLKLFD